MFKRQLTYAAFFLPGPDDLDPDEAMRLGLEWLVSEPGQPLVVLHAKKMATNNRLLAEGIRRHGIRVDSPRASGGRPSAGVAILAPWASEEVLRFIDDELSGQATGVCVIGWRQGAHDRWIAARGAVDLRTGERIGSGVLVSDPVVRLAIDEASETINHNNALVQAEDKAYVVLTLEELVRGGHAFDVDELVAYAMATGWRGEEVRRLEEYATRVLAGRRFRLQSSYGPPPGSCARWEAEARG